MGFMMEGSYRDRQLELNPACRRPDQKLSPGEGANGAQPCRKRKLTSNSSAVEWQRPQSLDSMAIALEERSPDHPPKRQPPNRPPLSICPAVILIDDDTSNDDAGR